MQIFCIILGKLVCYEKHVVANLKATFKLIWSELELWDPVLLGEGLM